MMSIEKYSMNNGNFPHNVQYTSLLTIKKDKIHR